MIKAEELSNPESCFNRALENERVFVLLARDAAAPIAIRAWINERLLSGKNQPTDPTIMEAVATAIKMDEERALVRRELGK